MGQITLQAVEKWFDETPVIKGVDLTIEDSEFIIFVGPSGCGKSTLLRMIAGLEDISRGKLIIDGNDATGQSPGHRGLAMVFQSYALYPHLTVRDNMGFSLKTAGCTPAEIKEKVDQASESLQLGPYLDRLPKDLSGGQRQRVAIGRCIVRNPTAFLFDEPLSNLDAALRVGMRYEIAKLHQSLNRTMIYVTHDQVEAMTLADRIVVLRDGAIEQVGSPKELYTKPDNLFVAQFIGSPKMNISDCSSQEGMLTLGAVNCGLPAPEGAVKLGIRPEDISIVTSNEGIIQGQVDITEYLGADIFLIIDCGAIGKISVRVDGETEIAPGDTVGLKFENTKTHFFNANGEAIR